MTVRVHSYGSMNAPTQLLEDIKMAIESDVQGADARLAVKFYKGKVQDTFQTEIQGRPIFNEIDMVIISVPGDNLSIIDTVARQHHKDKFPMQWARYQNSIAGQTYYDGTPLDQWPLVTSSQAEELRFFKFFTVEQVAQASDAQIQAINMIMGMSPHTFRERAQKYLKVASEEANLNAHDKEIEVLREENQRIKLETEQKLAEMQAQMSEILKSVKKPGRPARQEKEAA